MTLIYLSFKEREIIMKKKENYLLVALLTLACLFLPKQNVAAQGGCSEYITVSNVTHSSAKVDWSAMKSYIESKYSDGTCSDFTYKVMIGDTVFSESTKATNGTVSNLNADTAYFIEITCSYVLVLDSESYQMEEYEFEEFITGELNNVNDPGTQTQTPSNPGTPSKPNTQQVVLKKPVIQSMRLVDGTLSVIAGNVDTKYTEKLEWAVYDKKTNQLVKTDNSYSIADTIYGLDAKKVYYVKCRAVGSDANYNDVYSEWSDVKYIVSQPKVTSKNKDVKKSQVTIKWKKISGAKNYTVYVKKGKTKKWTKVKTTKSNKYVLKKFKGKKVNTFKNRYYFAVVANAKVNGKTLSSGKDEFYEAYSYYY